MKEKDNYKKYFKFYEGSQKVKRIVQRDYLIRGKIKDLKRNFPVVEALNIIHDLNK